MKHITYLLCFAGALVGCAMFGGDLIVRVSGTVPVAQSGEVAPECRLDVVSAETGRRTPSHVVQSKFSTAVMVVVDSNPKPYYFSVQCEDGREFRSRVVEIHSRSRNFELGILGEIEAEARSESN